MVSAAPALRMGRKAGAHVVGDTDALVYTSSPAGDQIRGWHARVTHGRSPTNASTQASVAACFSHGRAACHVTRPAPMST
jgi:hypothetical protein